MTTTVQSYHKMLEKPIVTTNNGLFLISGATVQDQQNLRFIVGLYRPVVVLRQLSQEAVQGADALLHRAYGVDGDKLVGLIRVPGDSETLAQIHYMLVHPDYQGQGIAGKMLELIKEKYKDYLYIESMPKDKSNVPLYVKHRFTMTENGAAIQICNYSNAQ